VEEIRKMSGTAEGEARRALARLQRAIEKSTAELDAVKGTLRHAEGADFPAADFEAAAAHLDALESFVQEQSARLADKMLHAGGIEPGRVRRSGGM
jgi:hypothetical protein